MGCGPSYELSNVELAPLAKPVAAINVRFCHEERLMLQQKASSFSATLKFCNTSTDAVRYTAKRGGFSSRVTLRDGSDTAIINAKGRSFSFKPIYYVRYGGEPDADVAFEIHARYHMGLKTEVHVSFTDLVTREPCELGFEGHWRKRTAYFWLDRGNSGVREPVAKVFCPEGASRSKFHIEVAPHMDTALITMVCAILTYRQRDEESS